MPEQTRISLDQLSFPIEAGTDMHQEQLLLEYESLMAQFQSQPSLVQRFLEAQGHQLGQALFQPATQVRFMLPDRIFCPSNHPEKGKLVPVPAEERDQLAGGLIDRITRTDLRTALRGRLAELEQSKHRSVATSAALIRFCTVYQMVHQILPAGRSVTYQAAYEGEIPSIPVPEKTLGSALTASTDAIAEDSDQDSSRGELLVPFVPAARNLYLPQWVSFDDSGNLLVSSVNEAEAHLSSMQQFIGVLHTAVALAPYVIADTDYQKKRYGILGQLINQGRALAKFETQEIIRTIKRRASAHDLNRGLSLSLPYFDDQSLEMKILDFSIIPAGRIMFVPAFVVRAAREEQVKVAQDTRFSASTRRYLLAELEALEQAFLPSPPDETMLTSK